MVWYGRVGQVTVSSFLPMVEGCCEQGIDRGCFCILEMLICCSVARPVTLHVVVVSQCVTHLNRLGLCCSFVYDTESYLSLFEWLRCIMEPVVSKARSYHGRDVDIHITGQFSMDFRDRKETAQVLICLCYAWQRSFNDNGVSFRCLRQWCWRYQYPDVSISRQRLVCDSTSMTILFNLIDI